MVQGIEFHGRLCRADGGASAAGSYDLCFTLHPDPTTRRSGWSEEHRGVQVDSHGRFAVVLGTITELRARHLKKAPRWVSVRRLIDGRPEEETGNRIPITGNTLVLIDLVERLVKRVEALDEKLSERTHPTGAVLQTQLDRVQDRLDRLAGPAIAELQSRLGALVARVEAVDGEDGRLDKVEDRVEDMDGPDGDLIDLGERVDALEDAGSGNSLVARLSKAEKVHRQLSRRLASLEARLPAEAAAEAAE